MSKTGATDRYSASVDLRFSPPQLKHGGPSLIDTTNYYLRPYFDPAVAFVGTMNGSWDETTRGQYPEWEGWNSWPPDGSQRIPPWPAPAGPAESSIWRTAETV